MTQTDNSSWKPEAKWKATSDLNAPDDNQTTAAASVKIWQAVRSTEGTVGVLRTERAGMILDQSESRW